MTYLAHDMREKADLVNNKSGKMVIDLIYSNILSAATVGIYSIGIKLALSEKQIKNFTDNGYTVSENTALVNGIPKSLGYIISWANGD
jgi:hypothetical protein